MIVTELLYNYSRLNQRCTHYPHPHLRWRFLPQVCHATFCHGMGGERWVWRIIRSSLLYCQKISRKFRSCTITDHNFKGYLGCSLPGEWSRSYDQVEVEQIDVEMFGQGGVVQVFFGPLLIIRIEHQPSGCHS